MLGSYFLLTLTFIIPVICALACFIVNSPRIRSLATEIGSFLLLVSIVVIFQKLANSRGEITIIVMNPPFDINLLIELAGFFLPAYFIYAGIKIRKIPVVVLSVLQIAAMVLLVIFTDIKSAAITITVNYISASVMFLVSTIAALAAFLMTKNVDLLEKKLRIKGRAQAVFISLIFIFSGAFNSMVTSDNMLRLFPFWGITTVCAFLLVFHVNGRMDDTAALQLLYINLISSVLFITAVIIFYITKGAVTLRDISKYVPFGNLICLIPPCMALISFAGFMKTVYLKMKGN